MAYFKETVRYGKYVDVKIYHTLRQYEALPVPTLQTLDAARKKAPKKRRGRGGRNSAKLRFRSRKQTGEGRLKS